MKFFQNKYRIYCIILVILVFLSVFIRDNLKNKFTKIDHTNAIDQLRIFNIDNRVMNGVREKSSNYDYDICNYMTALFIKNNYEIENDDLNRVKINRIKKEYPKEFEITNEMCRQIISDVKVFPVPKSSKNDYFVNFSNSWGDSRTYGGNRHHEGTDIMADLNERGVYPVLSMTDGVIEDIGWLELGGYRIGIRGENGGYFYYAHLAGYENGLKQGDSVKAGQILGMMGDTGYSKVEGTVGNFDVHLHVGIYLTCQDQTYSINPYYILKNLRIVSASY